MATPYATLSGAAFGVALNDAAQLANLADAFAQPPYTTPPKAPVLYVKPRTCFSFGGAATPLPADLDHVRMAAAIGVLFARDVAGASPDAVRGAVAAACLVLDVSAPSDGFYRPPIRQQCRDGFLPVGGFAALPAAFGEIVTEIDGREAHRWSLDRLVRPLETLVSEISDFMTLSAGDLLLLGVPGDAPSASAGQSVRVSSAGLPTLTTVITPEGQS